MKLHCQCRGTKFEIDINPGDSRYTKLICSKCHRDFLTDFGPRILKKVLENIFGKLLGYK